MCMKISKEDLLRINNGFGEDEREPTCVTTFARVYLARF